MLTFGSDLFLFEIRNPDGSVWDTVVVKADRVNDAARALGSYPGKVIAWVD